MPITNTELLLYKSAEFSDSPTNGGRMSANVITSAVKGNVWPDVSQSERTAGSNKFRKVFTKVANDADLTLSNPKIFIETQTGADDRVNFFAGTQTDTQTDLTGSERLFGGATANSAIGIGDATITILQEVGADVIFVAGDKIRLSDKTSVNDVGGSEEFVTISGGGVSAPTGDLRTLTIDSPGPLNAYSSGLGTKVSSVYEPSDIVSAFSSFVITSSLGSYVTGSNLIVDNIGGIEQDWTLTFTSATAYDLTGDTLGAVGSGNISGTFAPNNTDFTKPYFSMNSAGWGGTYISGDTITFTTAPAAISIWLERTVPAGASSFSANSVIPALEGESA